MVELSSCEYICAKRLRREQAASGARDVTKAARDTRSETLSSEMPREHFKRISFSSFYRHAREGCRYCKRNTRGNGATSCTGRRRPRVASFREIERIAAGIPRTSEKQTDTAGQRCRMPTDLAAAVISATWHGNRPKSHDKQPRVC